MHLSSQKTLWAGAALLLAGTLFVYLRRPSNQHETSATPRASSPAPAQDALAEPPTAHPSNAAASAQGLSGGGNLLLSASWGAAPGELGRLRAHESNPEDPMSLAATSQGGVCILDQVNDRVQCFDKRGALNRSFTLGHDAAQDLLVDEKGQCALLDRLGRPALLLYSPQGKLLAETPLVGGPVTEGGGVTALLTDSRGDYYVELEHREVVRIADHDGVADPERPTYPGRPSRDGKFFIAAKLQNAAQGTVQLTAYHPDKSPAWQKEIALEAPLSHLILLDSDAQGHIFLGAVIRAKAEKAAVVQVIRLNADGEKSGSLVLPAANDAAEKFRELTLTDDGSLVQLKSAADGVQVVKYSF